MIAPIAIYFSYLVKRPLILWVQDLWPESVIESSKFNSRIGYLILENGQYFEGELFGYTCINSIDLNIGY